VDFLYLGSIRDMTSVFVFVLIGLLVSFFNKNMIIILSSAMIVANVLKYGGINQRLVVEGFEEGAEDEDGAEEQEQEEDVNPTKKSKSKETDKKSKETDKKDSKTKETKEEFGQDKEVVYTSVDDMAINEQDKMMLANEKLLERMNKYKPLLDTLQGLTKNMAIMKGVASSVSELKEDIAKDEKKDKKE
jgi:flagellar motor protein MotB